MKIKFPQTKVVHKRKEPRKPLISQNPYFGMKGVLLTYKQAQEIYYKVQDFFDHWDVESEIDYREEEGSITHEQASKFRAQKEEIVEDYRGALDDDGHWNDVLMDILFRRARS